MAVDVVKLQLQLDGFQKALEFILKIVQKIQTIGSGLLAPFEGFGKNISQVFDAVNPFKSLTQAANKEFLEIGNEFKNLFDTFQKDFNKDVTVKTSVSLLNPPQP